MANQLTVNPWVIDTPVAAGVILFAGDLHNTQVEYVGYTADTDTVEVLDRYGNLVASLNGASDLRTVRTGRIGWIHGFTVRTTKLDSTTNMPTGKLICYFE